MSYDPIDAWLEKNTGMYCEPPTYDDRVKQNELEKSEQIDKVIRYKRLVYKFWYMQSKGSDSEWMPLGEQDFNNQDELWDYTEKLEKKYNSDVRSEKVMTRW